ncbi:uncharacterized protein LY79DRAFT_572036 [Colletotrichum navitas]|uniref:Uncharacterized protein n=1 Tax=Colletotrichum navitas TaxID=681940 RepID=A0AAD8PKE7_9PEZI|nr:uncharacterized protein LY79DRAFT_572036 [Colletotrichum navitas]KAK1569398.1 hypothetical protein LY79DRAFT_572036 [Colletotrichum navitas]
MSAAPTRPGTLQLSPAMSRKPTVSALSCYILQSQLPKTGTGRIPVQFGRRPQRIQIYYRNKGTTL